MRRLAVGPIRERRITCGLAYPAMFTVSVLVSGPVTPWVAAAIVLGLAWAARCAMTRVELREDEIVVVNLLHTVRVQIASIQTAGFAKPRWVGFAVPLVFLGEGVSVRSSGVSAWSRGLRWPDQPFVKGKRNLARVQDFLAGSGIAFDPREPVPRHVRWPGGRAAIGDVTPGRR